MFITNNRASFHLWWKFAEKSKSLKISWLYLSKFLFSVPFQGLIIATAQNEKIKLVFKTANPGYSVIIDDLRNILMVSTSAPWRSAYFSVAVYFFVMHRDI